MTPDAVVGEVDAWAGAGAPSSLSGEVAPAPHLVRLLAVVPSEVDDLLLLPWRDPSLP